MNLLTREAGLVVVEKGAIVRRGPTDEVGVLLEVDPRSGIAEVAFATGTALVPLEELEPAEPGPTERLVHGDIGPPEPYSLLLQARFLKHAYRFGFRAIIATYTAHPFHEARASTQFLPIVCPA